MNLGWVAVSRSTVQRQWLTPTPYWTSTLWRGTRHWPHKQETRPHGGATVYAPPGAYVEAGCHTHGTVWATLHTCWSPRLGWKGDRTTVEEASGALQQWGFRQYLPFSWTTLRGKHRRHHIAVMGVVDMFEHGNSTTTATKFASHEPINGIWEKLWQRKKNVLALGCCLHFGCLVRFYFLLSVSNLRLLLISTG